MCSIHGLGWDIYFYDIVFSHSVMSDSLWPHGLEPTRLLCPWGSPGKNSEVGCHALLQGIFLTWRSNLTLMSPVLTGEFSTTGPLGKSLSNILEFHCHTRPSSCCCILTRYSDSQTAYAICFQRRNSPLGFCSYLPLVIGLKANGQDGTGVRGEQAAFCELPASGVVCWGISI